MKNKIIGIVVVTLLIATAVLPVVGTMNVSKYSYEETGCFQNVHVLEVGVCDGLAGSTEPINPSTVLESWIQDALPTIPLRECDEKGDNKWWAHTFDLMGTCNLTSIIAVTLVIWIDNEDFYPDNDGMNIGCIEFDGDAWEIHKRLSPGSPTNWNVDLYAGLVRVEVDLAFEDPFFFADLVSGVCTHIDVIVQDDSYVDCATLTIECDCDCVLEIEIQPGFYFGIPTATLPVKITNIGNTDCIDIIWSITSTAIFGTASFLCTGSIPLLTHINSQTVVCNPIGFFGIMEITAQAVVCGLTYTDTTYALVFGPFLFVI